MSIKAIKLAQDLKALADRFSEGWHDGIKIDASDIMLLSAAAEAIEQAQKQEPVAYRSRMRNRDGQVITGWVVHLDTTENPDPRVEIEPLYTSPPQRQPLTDEQIQECWLQQSPQGLMSGGIDFARAIEAFHGIKE